MDEHRKQAGLRLAQLREAQGLSQEELSHLAGVSVKTISRFENGRHDGRRSTVRALAKALKVNEQDIIGPPPEPLGLGETQLDRMEAKLDEILSRLPEVGLAEGLEAEAARVRAQQARSGAKSPRTGRTRKAS